MSKLMKFFFFIYSTFQQSNGAEGAFQSKSIIKALLIKQINTTML